jgi:hypothetical protein
LISTGTSDHGESAAAVDRKHHVFFTDFNTFKQSERSFCKCQLYQQQQQRLRRLKSIWILSECKRAILVA